MTGHVEIHHQMPARYPAVGGMMDLMVDEELVELLELLWRNGVETYFSCQGGQIDEYGEVPGYIMLGREAERKEVGAFMDWLPGMVSLKPHWKDKQNMREILLDRVGYYTEYSRYSGNLTLTFRNDMIPFLKRLLSIGEFVLNEMRRGRRSP